MAMKGEVYRMTIATEEILGLLESLSCLTPAQLTTGARSIQKKFQIQAAKINIGAATPAYKNTGVNSSRVHKITLADLGAEEEFQGTHLPTNLTPADLQASPSLGEELTPELEAELERLNAQMLAELASNGAGSQNVVLVERRKVSRDREVEPTITVDDL
jgi:hypothetical protein